MAIFWLYKSHTKPNNPSQITAGQFWACRHLEEINSLQTGCPNHAGQFQMEFCFKAQFWLFWPSRGSFPQIFVFWSIIKSNKSLLPPYMRSSLVYMAWYQILNLGEIVIYHNLIIEWLDLVCLISNNSQYLDIRIKRVS